MQQYAQVPSTVSSVALAPVQSDDSACFIDTVADNMKLFTQHQIKAAKQARELYHSLGRPTRSDFRKIIKTNLIHNNPVTVEDVAVAETIFGPDVGALKGRSTCKKSQPIVMDYVEIPKLLLQQHVHIAL